MNNNSNFVDAFISAVQIWNLEMDIEDSNMENIEMRAVNRFVYSDLINGGTKAWAATLKKKTNTQKSAIGFMETATAG